MTTIMVNAERSYPVNFTASWMKELKGLCEGRTRVAVIVSKTYSPDLAELKSLDSDRHTQLKPIPGTPPSLINLPAGCPFHSRCQYAESMNGKCESEVPELKAVGNSWSACHLPLEVLSMSVKESR